MISERQISEILAQYAKHGWSLRRVLLSAQMRDAVSAAAFRDAEIVSSDVNAAWFSRAAGAGRETWELRHLSNAPFALVEVFEEEDEELVREEIRSEMETQLIERASKPERQKPPVER